jgi:YwiC-like protein
VTPGARITRRADPPSEYDETAEYFSGGYGNSPARFRRRVTDYGDTATCRGIDFAVAGFVFVNLRCYPVTYLPKEHGAYGQVAFPLVTALGVSGVSTGGLLISVAVIAGFLAHEPAAIVLGLRGSRAKREIGTSATQWLSGCLAIAVAAGIWAVVDLDPAARRSLAIPAVPAVLLVLAMVQGHEKSWYGEAAAALAFAGASVPVTMAAGASMNVALAVAIPFALLFTTTTLAVRSVILRVRGGGDPRATMATRGATLAIASVATAAIGAMTVAGWLSSSVLLASAPGLITASIVAARPPAPARLRLLGWTLVAISTLTAAIVVATV